MTITETAPAPAAVPNPAAIDPSADLARRIDRLERQVSTLRKRVRRYEREIPPILQTPEMAAYVDELEAYVDANPNEGTPWEVVEANIRAKLGMK